MSLCMCVSLSAGLRCRVASRYAILETPLQSGSQRGTRGKCVWEGEEEEEERVFSGTETEESFPGCVCTSDVRGA